MASLKKIGRVSVCVVSLVFFLFVFCSLLYYSVLASVDGVRGAAATLGVVLGAFIYVASFMLCVWSFVRSFVVEAGPVPPWLRREVIEERVIGILTRWARQLPSATRETTSPMTTTTTIAAASPSASDANIKFVSRAAQPSQGLAEKCSEAKIKANAAMSESMRARAAVDALEAAELKLQVAEEEEAEGVNDANCNDKDALALGAGGQPTEKKKVYIKALSDYQKKKAKQQRNAAQKEGEEGTHQEEDNEDDAQDTQWLPAYVNEADNPIRMAERRERKLQRGMTIRSVAQVARDALDAIVRCDTTTGAAAGHNALMHDAHHSNATASIPQTTVVNIPTSPHTTTASMTDAKTEQMKILLHGVNLCPRCDVYQFANTHHCKYCDVCVFQQSNHCFALGQCAAYNNIKYVLLCEVYASVWCAVGVLITILSLSEEWSSLMDPYTGRFNVVYYYAFVAYLACLVSFVAVVINNTVSICKGRSLQREMRRRERLQRAVTERATLQGSTYVPLDAREDDADEFLSYREADATLDNFKNAVGEEPNVLLWFVPVAPWRWSAEVQLQQFMEELDRIVDVQLHAIADVEDAEEQFLDAHTNNPSNEDDNNNNNNSGTNNEKPISSASLTGDVRQRYLYSGAATADGRQSSA